MLVVVAADPSFPALPFLRDAGSDFAATDHLNATRRVAKLLSRESLVLVENGLEPSTS
jgi:hypothetical protein